MSSEPTTVQSDLSELIAENFGANATYVEALLARFRSDPSLVDESWRTYFEELLGNGQPAQATKEVPAKPSLTDEIKAGDDGRKAAMAAASPKAAKATIAETATEKIKPIRGCARKMDQQQ